MIVGGESGPKARPMHPQWVRSIRDQCVQDGVRFFFKQWGEWAPSYRLSNAELGRYETHHFKDGSLRSKVVMHRIGKKAAGRELDGRVWDHMPSMEDVNDGLGEAQPR